MTVLKTIYGKDTRTNIHTMDPCNPFTQKLKEQSLSVACLVESYALKLSGDHYELTYTPITLNETVKNTQKAPLGPKELFRDERVFGFGTAFLVSSRLALTAGHCLYDYHSKALRNLEEISLIFERQITTNNDKNPSVFKKERVFSITSVVSYKYDQYQDWALIELDREAAGLKPLRLEFEQAATKAGLVIYMLGHPVGLPLKYSGEGKVTYEKDDTFGATINAFSGNSGSPVFNKATSKVIGILIRGHKDFELDNDTGTVTAYDPGVDKDETSQKASLDIQKDLLKYHAQIRAGFNLRAFCHNRDCHAYQKEVVIRRYSGAFDLGKESCTAPLPCCGEKAQKIGSMVLSQCKWSFEGYDRNGNKYRQVNTTVGNVEEDILPRFNNWQYCSIDIKCN